MNAAYINYAASVAFALMAAYLIGGKGAAFACMLAWLATYVGMYAYAMEAASDPRSGFFHGVAAGLTILASACMIAAWLSWVLRLADEL